MINIKSKLGLVSIAMGLFTSGCNIFSHENIISEAAMTHRLSGIKQKGNIVCGVNGQLPGFSLLEKNGAYSGLDVDLCRAIAAALFDDPAKVEYQELNAQERFSAVKSGKVDVLSRNTTWTLSRDTAEGMEFAPTTFYDGQGLLVEASAGIEELDDLNRKEVCILSGTTNEENLVDRMRRLSLNFSPVSFEDADQMYAAYEAGRCHAVTSDRSQLIIRLANFNQPEEHKVLDLVISKEPLGPLTANGDSQWFNVVKWTVYAMVKAEELGLTSENIDLFAQTKDPKIRRFLGLEGNLGKALGLPNDFAWRIVKHVGNYGEVYQRNIGQPFGLKRNLNSLVKDGGLMSAPPFR